MRDDAVQDLARRAGIAVEWTDAGDRPRTVGIETLRQILTALGLPCRGDGDIAESRARLERQDQDIPALIVATVGHPIALGPGREVKTMTEIGYHPITINGRETMLAVAPERCFGIDDLAPGGRLWGLAVQLYSLRRDGDGGIGDFGGAVAMARGIAPFGADALALSPTHALFAARPDRYSPYGPSSRLFLNPLLADPALVFGAERVARARAGQPAIPRDVLIDWSARGPEKLALFRILFDEIDAAAASDPLAADLARFCAEQGAGLRRHALFETLDAAAGTGDWRSWPAEWRDPTQAEAASPYTDGEDIRFHLFLQWLAQRSFAAAQQAALETGLRIGLIADIAVGVDPSGSDAWSCKADMLTGLSIGAPPDLFNPAGQNWGLTAFSPRALALGGYAPFIATLRAAMSGAGGIRVDHAMGLRRLWLIPDGAGAGEGAYLTYPFETLLRLIALESRLNRAIVIAEDLGTVPPGFSDRLNAAGILGMSILWFTRDRDGFTRPQGWRRDATAMTSTHDLPTVAGWWRGDDIGTRDALGFYRGAPPVAEVRAQRGRERAELWRALRDGAGAEGRQPPPRGTAKVTEGAIRFVARTPSRLALIPLEDLVGEKDQPNLPGTIAEHPNWRRRQKATAEKLLKAPKVAARLAALQQERGRQ